MTEAPEPGANRWLLARGWDQGTLFDGKGIAIPWQDMDKTGHWKLPVPARLVKTTERLILATQACDLVSVNEATIDALLCVPHAPKDIPYRSGNLNSARYFLVDPGTGLVAYAHCRVQLKKKSLSSLDPIPWPSDGMRRRHFVRWLARRYDRPALPDLLHAELEAPISTLLTTLWEKDPNLARLVTSACREWRINEQIRNGQLQEDPPFEVELLLVLNRSGITTEEADALDEVIDLVWNEIDQTKVHLHQTVLRLSAEQISWAMVERTVPLFLDPRTYQGDEIAGAEPLHRA